MASDQLDLEHWNYLEDQWDNARKAACDAQVALDFKLRNYLVSGKQAPAPTLEDQEAVDKLWFCEAERRGAMDEFLAEHFESNS